VNMLWLLLRLRQACNHPWLVRGTAAQYGGAGSCAPSGALGSPGGKVTASQLSAAKKLAGQQCEQLLQTLQQEPSVCAQCGDISEEAVVSACCHVFCRQCITMQVHPVLQPSYTLAVIMLIVQCSLVCLCEQCSDNGVLNIVKHAQRTSGCVSFTAVMLATACT